MFAAIAAAFGLATSANNSAQSQYILDAQSEQAYLDQARQKDINPYLILRNQQTIFAVVIGVAVLGVIAVLVLNKK